MAKTDKILKFLIVYSTIMYLVEMVSGTKNSYESPQFYLWSERIVALIFTSEIVLRAFKAFHNSAINNSEYVYGGSAMFWIDILAVLPFWLGFAVPVEYLGIVRTLRVLRLLKFFRYSRGLQLVALGFYKAFNQLKYLAFPILIAIIFSTVLIFEAEHKAQPEAFDSLFSAFWFTTVTVTTVGYGDISPSTVAGKLIVIFTFVSVLSLFAGFIGVVGNAMSDVLKDEIDPSIDPIQEFSLEREKRKLLKLKHKGQSNV